MLLDKLAARLDELQTSAISGDSLQRVRTFVLNALACAYDGAASPEMRAVRGLLDETAGSGLATVWTTGSLRAPLDATFANCVAIHGSLQEDMHAATVTHPGTLVIPAVLALAEHLHATGETVARSIVVGYEAVGQIGRLAATPTFFGRGWRAPSVFGTFGSAAGAAAVLGLRRDQMVDALALAANVAGGISAYKSSGTGEGGIANASGARCGLESAVLASRGVTAAPNALEAPLGFLHAFSGDADTADWPHDGAHEITHIYIKPFESCAYNCETIEATRRMVRRRALSPREIRRVTAKSYAKAKHNPGCDNPGPFADRLSSQMSGQFGIAAVLLDGDLMPERYDNYSDSAISELAARIFIEVDEVAEGLFPQKRRSTLTVELNDGNVLTERVDDLASPDFAAVADRFRRVARSSLGDDSSGQIVESVGRLETLDDIRELTALLRRQVGQSETYRAT